jgi:hypothetical protein
MAATAGHDRITGSSQSADVRPIEVELIIDK